eukprot:m.380025 g.380025  ORF g.380025 m.380025 type:complete len:92 (-) comp56222_c0_seq3:4138-4413(-)
MNENIRSQHRDDHNAEGIDVSIAFLDIFIAQLTPFKLAVAVGLDVRLLHVHEINLVRLPATRDSDGTLALLFLPCSPPSFQLNLRGTLLAP